MAPVRKPRYERLPFKKVPGLLPKHHNLLLDVLNSFRPPKSFKKTEAKVAFINNFFAGLKNKGTDLRELQNKLNIALVHGFEGLEKTDFHQKLYQELTELSQMLYFYHLSQGQR